ncbi:RNA-dependent RNA polymerase [Emericellopsis cladophorae]|uniref:RNA-dependent RNA polymerase n=1 Tax=Emericellopsis cladophorae TaxID=2686198 RepID=A0A9Q0BAW0_9HYPO|nr:RNA-dependent RNA polymerase [Emericellopsis cladophorae]KAI6778657.1 RNA-dependent RNA polymerase [Emericellopsis cladophorae]
MEVVCKNVPPDLDRNTLRKELTPFVEALKIEVWECEKLKNRKIAFIQFLNPSDGQRFLAKHGQKTAVRNKTAASPTQPEKQPSKSRNIPRLRITNTAIFVEKSNRPLNLGHMQHEQHQQRQQARGPARDQSASQALEFDIHRLEAGHNAFRKTALTFFRATSAPEAHIMHVRMTPRVLTITKPGEYRFEIFTNTVQSFVYSDVDNSCTLVLAEPPRCFAAVGELNSRGPEYERSDCCLSWRDHGRYVADCLVYKFTILRRDGNERAISDLADSIRDHQYAPFVRYRIAQENHPEPFVQDFESSMTSFRGRLDNYNLRKGALPFPVLFQVQALVSNNYLHPSAGSRLLAEMDKIASEARADGAPFPLTVDAIKKLHQDIPWVTPETDPNELHVPALAKLVVQYASSARRENPAERHPVYGTPIPGHQAWIMKAMITPTRIIFHGPEAESQNRILRMFPNHTDYFIRCLFVDEDGQDMMFNPKVSNEPIYRRWRKILKDGFRVGGRHYSFFAFSHSSLRSHSVWFMAPFTDDEYMPQDYDSIIRLLGTFDDIRVPAKCAARIGQAFSETPYAVPIFKENILTRYIPDIKSRDGVRVFSDGVGTISKGAMEIFWKYLPESAAAVTCFQIRYGGAKGMLSLDTRLPGKMICIRNESMQKFQSNDLKEVGICDTASRPLRLMLNRQMIKILEDMGTRDQWFIDLQNKELRFLRAVTASANNTSTFLRHQLIGTNMGFPQFIRELYYLGIDYRRDVFLRTVVENVVLRELRLLKHKARIPVEQGVTLFGIMDETGFLKEGEIYITSDKANQIAKPPSKGFALVTRSPALHPGDIQVVNMVEPPIDSPLRSLTNCVVFSRNGRRDLPSQLSGGDLDGDLYSVIWDPAAFVSKQFEPADYPRVSPTEVDRKVTRDDIADFFINFMKTDILGMIATRHQILADTKDEGTVDADCLKLAGLHSTAVDSSKTGIPVDVKHLPKPPRTRPDFLAPAPPLKLYDLGQVAHIADDEGIDIDGGYRPLYHRSKKLLGRLYRNVDENKIWSHDIRREVDKEGPSVWQLLWDYVEREILAENSHRLSWRQRINRAWDIRDMYENSITEKMWDFSENPRSPITEVEVFCGFILNKRGSQTRRQRDSSIKLKEAIDQTMTWIVNMIRLSGPPQTKETGEDDEAHQQQHKEEHQDDVVELCLACLYVGCMMRVPGDRGQQLQSFKVVAACCLIREMKTWPKRRREYTYDTGPGRAFSGTASYPDHFQTTLPLR